MDQFRRDGYQIIEEIFSIKEVEEIIQIIDKKYEEPPFAIRYFLKDTPALIPKIFNQKLVDIIEQFSPNARIIKSIYFDKPPTKNWIVTWHQDLTINVVGRTDHIGFKNWRFLNDRTVVQPPLSYLENIFTIRIHLDSCDESNGALRIIKKSHQQGITPVKHLTNNFRTEEKICKVKKGGILLMRPLTLHASNRTENKLRRRVVHIEFSDKELPKGLSWLEEQKINA